MHTFPHHEDKMNAASAFLIALGNTNRLRVLYLISNEEISVSRLADMVGLSQSSLSQHLLKLRKHGLVQWRRDSQMIYYRCDNRSVHRMLDLVHEMFVETAIDQSPGRRHRAASLVAE